MPEPIDRLACGSAAAPKTAAPMLREKLILEQVNETLWTAVSADDGYTIGTGATPSDAVKSWTDQNSGRWR